MPAFVLHFLSRLNTPWARPAAAKDGIPTLTSVLAQLFPSGCCSSCCLNSYSGWWPALQPPGLLKHLVEWKHLFQGMWSWQGMLLFWEYCSLQLEAPLARNLSSRALKRYDYKPSETVYSPVLWFMRLLERICLKLLFLFRYGWIPSALCTLCWRKSFVCARVAVASPDFTGILIF